MNNKVYIRHREDYALEGLLPIVRDTLLWGKMDRKIGPDTTVLLKPNMLSRSAPDKAVTTNPAVLDCVIAVLKEFGANPENITVADSSGGTVNRSVLRGNYKTCGFTAVCEKHGVVLYTDQKGVMVKTDGKMVKEFELIEPAVNCDVIISLAKFKTHVMTGMSGAVKNLFGTVPGLKKAEFHMRFPDKDNFCNMMVDLCDGAYETEELASAFIAENGYTFPVFIAKTDFSYYNFGFQGIPASVFIDANGVIVDMHVGAMDESGISDALESILSAK